jgi:ATP-dependent Lon protease
MSNCSTPPKITGFKRKNYQLSDSESSYDDSFIVDDSEQYSELSSGSNRSEDRKYRKYFKKAPKDIQEKLHQAEQSLKNQITDIDTPLKARIYLSNAPLEIKTRLMYLYEHRNDDSKNKIILDTILKIPWNKYSDLPIQLTDGFQAIQQYLSNAKYLMDKYVYGHHEPKNLILETLGQFLINPEATSLFIGIEGPPGTGKTTLMKYGIAQAIGRPFCPINLGAAKSGDYLNGSQSVWIGSKHGKIVDGLIESGCMDPAFYFDELCKISQSDHGKEISDVLLSIIDNRSNSTFEDKFLGIPINIGRGIYMFSYNDHNDIDYILGDRICRVVLKEYTTDDKINIITNHTWEMLLDKYKFSDKDVILEPETIRYIIDRYTDEKGIRELIRILERLLLKINLCRLSDRKTFNNLMNIKGKAGRNGVLINVPIKNFSMPYRIKKEDLPLLF